MRDEIVCLQCGETQAAVKKSQRDGDPIYCDETDYLGETGASWATHRFRDWTDRELSDSLLILPEHIDKYRRVMSHWQIDPAHMQPITRLGDDE